MALEDLKAAIPPNNMHLAQPRVIALENTHNLCNGRVITTEYVD